MKEQRSVALFLGNDFVLLKAYSICFMKKIGLGLFVLFHLSACEKDDICDGGLSATPNVVINMYDRMDSEVLKPAAKVCIIAEGFNDTIVFRNRSQIQLPLQINKTETTWKILLYEPIANNDTLIKREDLKFTYTPEAQYVSKACGYKTNFLGFNAVKLENTTGDAWIQSIYKLTTEITDQSNAHIQLFY